MNDKRTHWLAILALCAPMVLSSVTGWAQTTDRSGIEGKIVDQSGASVPGVTVTITSPALQRPQMMAVSNDNGNYRFTALPNGVYTVTFELTGFQTIERKDVRLDVGFVATLDMKMVLGAVSETVTVTGGAPVVDVRTTGVNTNFGKEALETVPTSRSIWQVIDMAPGMRNTTTTPDVGGSMTGTQETFSNYGFSRAGNRPTVEGIDVHDTAGDSSFYYDFGAFDEVQVKAMGNDAEMPYAGTQLVAVIKSGGNTFHGKSLFQIEDPKLQSNNIDDALRATGVTAGNPLKRYFDFSADTGGPITRDRLWFYGAIRRQRIRSQVIGFAGDNLTDLNNYTSKFTGQLTNRQKLVGFVQDTNKDSPSVAAAPSSRRSRRSIRR